MDPTFMHHLADVGCNDVSMTPDKWHKVLDFPTL